MKKSTLNKLLKAIAVFVLSVAFTANVQAQTWCPVGATWYYANQAPWADGYIKLTYANDTVINSITCKKITYYSEGQTAWLGHFAGYSESIFTHEQNGVAYIYNNRYGANKFDTLFNINAQIGDKWRLPFVDTACADSTYFMKVLNIGTKMINGFSLKWLHVKTGPFPNGGFANIDTVIERFGYRYDNIGYGICSGIAEETPWGDLRCYADDAFGFYSTGISVSCDYYYTGIAESKIGQDEFYIYPNPATNLLTINFTNTYNTSVKFIVYNTLGEIVQTMDMGAKPGLLSYDFDLSNYAKGVYFIQVQNNNTTCSKKFIKQ